MANSIQYLKEMKFREVLIFAVKKSRKFGPAKIRSRENSAAHLPRNAFRKRLIID